MPKQKEFCAPPKLLLSPLAHSIFWQRAKASLSFGQAVVTLQSLSEKTVEMDKNKHFSWNMCLEKLLHLMKSDVKKPFFSFKIYLKAIRFTIY